MNCPCCGQKVDVHQGDEGTGSYIPLERIEADGTILKYKTVLEGIKQVLLDALPIHSDPRWIVHLIKEIIKVEDMK